MIKSSCTRLTLCLTAAGLLAATGTACSETDNRINSGMSNVRHIEPNSETGTSLAAVVENGPLAFTNQLFPFDAAGNLVGRDDLAIQVDQVLNNMETALEEAGTGPGNLVRIHVYASDDAYSEDILRLIGQKLPDATNPAVTFVTGNPPYQGVLVSMDAIAVAPQDGTSRRVARYHTTELYGPENQSHVAVLSAGRKLFISGQAEVDETLEGAASGTMQGLLATLAYAGANADDIVQIKAFVSPVDDMESVEEMIASFFRGNTSPPVISVEWFHDSFPTEIELVAAAPEILRTDHTVSYYAPPWMTQAATFSRVTDVQKGDLLFTSSLYGEPGENGENQARRIFDTLSRVLDAAGSDYDHLLKATYYASSDEGADGLRNVRTDFYNPERPPAASLAEIRGTGRAGTDISVDMIGVIPE
ncbi:MAG: Rid family hydrolase [Balneolaceae bacterium]